MYSTFRDLKEENVVLTSFKKISFDELKKEAYIYK